MYTMNALIYVVTVFVVFAGAANVAKRLIGTCPSLRGCNLEVHNILRNASIPHSVYYLTTEEYTQVCRLNNETQSCTDEEKVNCIGLPTELSLASGFADKLGYICSDEGRESHARVVNSQCVTNLTIGLQAKEWTMQCMVTFQLNVETAQGRSLETGVNGTLCPLIRTVRDCVLTSQTSLCGNEFGIFALKLWAKSYKPFVIQWGCGDFIALLD